MKSTQEINIVSIQYKNDEKARQNFIRFILDYLLEHHCFEKGDQNDQTV